MIEGGLATSIWRSMAPPARMPDPTLGVHLLVVVDAERFRSIIGDWVSRGSGVRLDGQGTEPMPSSASPSAIETLST